MDDFIMIFGVMLMLLGGVGIFVFYRSPTLVYSSGKPLAEPRVLSYLDAWQTVIFGAGDGADKIKNELLTFFQGYDQNRFTFSLEKIWRWGLDGKVEREQIVLSYGRGLIFCQIYKYGSDLYIGWDAHLNIGSWMERELAKGIDRETGKRVKVMTIEQAVQPFTEFDLVDLNCLLEWTHAQVTQVLKKYIKESEIDQEIDFAIIRGDRQSIIETDETKKKRGSFKRVS